jgi:molecular chaperone HtpG
MKDESSNNLICEIKVALYLKEDLEEFLEEKKTNDLIKKSLIVLYPINLYCEKTKEEKDNEKEDETKQLMKKK